MNMLVASLTFLPLFTVAFAHYLWAFGNTWPIRNEALLAQTVVGRPGITKMPNRFVTFVVATALIVFGIVALSLADPVAGGVGLAPFWTLAQSLAARGTRATLFYGARRAEELFYLDVFRNLGVELVLTTEDGSAGEKGRVIAPLDRALAARNADRPVTIYACGPEGMLESTARTAARFDRRCEVSVERIMGCGMGGCYSCVVPMKDEAGGFHHVRSCITGPVIDAAQIVWD